MLTLLFACFSGLCVGLYGAIQPGPLMALIVAESIRRGRKAGMKVGCVPVLTDPIILLFGVIFVAVIPKSLAAVLSFIGGLVLILFGRQSLRELDAVDSGGSPQEARSVPRSERGKQTAASGFLKKSGTEHSVSGNLFARGLIVNLLNPYLYIFAFTINAPIISGYLKSGRVFSAFGYPLFFFVGIITVNGVIAVMAGTFKARGSPRLIRDLSRFLGYGLFVMAALALWRGVLFLL